MFNPNVLRKRPQMAFDKPDIPAKELRDAYNALKLHYSNNRDDKEPLFRKVVVQVSSGDMKEGWMTSKKPLSKHQMLKYAEKHFRCDWDDFDVLFGFQTHVEVLTVSGNEVRCNCYFYGRHHYCRSAIMLGHRLGVTPIPDQFCEAFVQHKGSSC
jgi:hypothetical protein